jgi:putative Mg2+ transporter-C (MgtC) family protein
MQNPWLQWWTDNVSLLAQPTFPRLLLAMLLGSVIGAERQWRQRAAGLRTNTLVCFGAAAFVDLASTVGGPNNTNVIAYVVSGVGFLGAGAIMKDGGSIRGLNTAATLWCSAAVGACAGAGELLDAVFVTILLVTINLALRPLSRVVDKRSLAATRNIGIYRLVVVSSQQHEQAVSALILRSLAAARPLTLRELRTEETEDSEEVLIQAVVESGNRDKVLIEKLVSEWKTDPNVSGVEWAETNLDTD